MATGNLIEVTDETFDAEVLRHDGPVLVKFWAPWCMPCKIIAPSIEEIADMFAGRVKVCRLNTDENTQTREAQKITAIPTLLVFVNGRLAKRFVGLTKRDDVARALDDELAPAAD